MSFAFFSVFSRSTDDCDGDFDLRFEFHAKELAKIQANDIIRWPTDMFLAVFEASQKAFWTDWTVFGAGGPKNRLFGCPKGKTHMMYFDLGNRNLPEKIDLVWRKDVFWAFFEP